MPYDALYRKFRLKSGLGDLLRIQWRTCPICHLPIGHDHLEGLQDPYVTFLSADQLREHHTIFMAEEFDVVNGPNR